MKLQLGPRGGRLPNVGGFWLVLFSLWASAWAHEDAEFHLAGLRFCVDPNSVQVRLEMPNGERAVAGQRSLRQALRADLRNVLGATGVRADFAESCADSPTYTILTVEARYLDPESYVGFEPRSYAYVVYMQVGRHDGLASLLENQLLPDNRYNAYTSEIYAEPEGGEMVEAFMVEPAETLVWKLAGFWWEDNPLPSHLARFGPPAVGGLLALLTVLLLLRLRKVGLLRRRLSLRA